MNIVHHVSCWKKLQLTLRNLIYDNYIHKKLKNSVRMSIIVL